MTVSLQLSLWALPPILAVLLALRDAGFLWPRRRERGTVALLGLAATVGVWAVLDLVSVVTPSLEVARGSTALEYLPSALAPVAWAWFALVHVRRRGSLTRWPMLLLYAGAATVAGVALAPDAASFLVRSATMVDRGGGVGLEVAHGPLHWAWLVARATAILASTWVVSRHVARLPGFRTGAGVAAVAALLATVPPFLPPLLRPGAEWMDLSSTGLALGASLLVWGLLRPRILNLGPVDRELVLAELRDPLVVMDDRGQLVDANRVAKEQLDLRPYGEIPLALGTLWATGPAPEGTPPPRIVLRTSGGEMGTFEVTLAPLDEGRTRRAALLLRDVTVRERVQRELELANAELERLARTDPLTGLANRRHFLERLEGEMDRARRYDRPLSLVLLDLDHFKKVNDTHGHAAGDEVLRVAATALRSVCRDVDLAARLGGEEMALLLPETVAEGARVVAERVRERIQAHSHTAPSGVPFRVTASFGVAAATGRIPSGEALLQASDEALYQAKERGRNRVVTRE